MRKHTTLNRHLPHLLVSLLFILPVCAAQAAIDPEEANRIAIERRAVASLSAGVEDLKKNLADRENRVSEQKKKSQDAADKIKAVEDAIKRKQKALSWLEGDKYADTRESVRRKIDSLKRRKRALQEEKELIDFELNQLQREMRDVQQELADAQTRLKKARQRLNELLKKNPDIAEACRGCDEVLRELKSIGSPEAIDKALKAATLDHRNAVKRLKAEEARLKETQQASRNSASSSSSSSGGGGLGGGILGTMDKVIEEIGKADIDADDQAGAVERAKAEEKALAEKLAELEARKKKYAELAARRKACEKNRCYPKKLEIEDRKLGEPGPEDADGAGAGTEKKDGKEEKPISDGARVHPSEEQKDKRKEPGSRDGGNKKGQKPDTPPDEPEHSSAADETANDGKTGKGNADGDNWNDIIESVKEVNRDSHSVPSACRGLFNSMAGYADWLRSDLSYAQRSPHFPNNMKEVRHQARSREKLRVARREKMAEIIATKREARAILNSGVATSSDDPGDDSLSDPIDQVRALWEMTMRGLETVINGKSIGSLAEARTTEELRQTLQKNRAEIMKYWGASQGARLVKLTDQAYRLEKELRQIDTVLRKLDMTAVSKNELEDLRRTRDRWLDAKAKLAACVEKAESGTTRGVDSPRIQDSQ